MSTILRRRRYLSSRAREGLRDWAITFGCALLPVLAALFIVVVWACVVVYGND